MKSIITALKTAHAAPDQPEQHVSMKDDRRPIENDNHFCINAIVFPMCNFYTFIICPHVEKVNRFSYEKKKKPEQEQRVLTTAHVQAYVTPYFTCTAILGAMP
ncbi:hypothetical protein P9847_07780 [Paenibacillus chibensis]|uniref:Uncharacterized protein n=1 Tax=Paenibacillus chibensis TaxID=59846 RepID=A0ABU6PT68_9BACL|nr:hypothetical protein [Paenibacillus chibensis]